MTSVLNSMIAGLHFDERRSKENGQDVVRRSLYKYIYFVCGALVLGGLYRWNATLPVFLDRFSPRAARATVKFGRGGLSKCGCGRLRNFAVAVIIDRVSLSLSLFVDLQKNRKGNKDRSIGASHCTINSSYYLRVHFWSDIRAAF